MFVSGRPLPSFLSFSMTKPIICFSRESQTQLLEQNLVWLGCLWCLVLSYDCRVPWEVRGGYFWCLVFLVWDLVFIWVFQFESSHHHHHHHPIRSTLFRIKAELCCAQADPVMAMVGRRWGEVGAGVRAVSSQQWQRLMLHGVVQCRARGICDLSSQVCLMLGELSGILLWTITGTFEVFPVLWRSHLLHSKCLAVPLNF